MKRINYLLLFLASMSLASCEFLEFSPNEVDMPSELQDLTTKNLGRLGHLKSKDTLKVALTGDTQRYLNDSRDLIDAVNARSDIDLLLHTGDFTDFGINREYVWMGEIFNSLDIPWLVAVGNHDLVGNGPQIYETMFGKENFYFDLDHFRFIFYDSNSREAGFNGRVPDLNWMSDLSDSTRAIVTVSHIPTYNSDFDQTLIPGYHDVLDFDLDVMLNINGHHHDYGAGVLPGTGISYINTLSCSKREYIILELTRDGHSHERIEF